MFYREFNFLADRRLLPNFDTSSTFKNFLFKPFSVLSREPHPSVDNIPFDTGERE